MRASYFPPSARASMQRDWLRATTSSSNTAGRRAISNGCRHSPSTWSTGRVALIAAISGTPAALAAKSATTAIPIVFAIGGDPIAPGLVPNLSRPGGNITGVSFYSSPVATKRLDLARELVGKGARIAVLFNPNNPPGLAEGRAVQDAAEAIGQALEMLRASTPNQIDEAFVTIE